MTDKKVTILIENKGKLILDFSQSGQIVVSKNQPWREVACVIRYESFFIRVNYDLSMFTSSLQSLLDKIKQLQDKKINSFICDLGIKDTVQIKIKTDSWGNYDIFFYIVLSDKDSVDIKGETNYGNINDTNLSLKNVLYNVE